MNRITIQFEDLDGRFYPVALKPQSKKLTATQNAGNSGYQVGGAGINGAFSSQFRKLGILEEVNEFLDKNTPEDTDSNANILVPLSGDSNMADLMVYSVGPNMAGSNTFSAKNQKIIYGIYVDAVTQLIKYNQKAQNKITCFRITMVSANIFGPIAPLQEYKCDLVSVILKALLNSMLVDNNKYLDTVLIQKDDQSAVTRFLRSKKPHDKLFFDRDDLEFNNIFKLEFNDITYESESDSE